MIGVDTNILVRVFVPDAPAQTAKALSFLDKRTAEDPAYVSVVVIIEMAWVLKRIYGFSAEAILLALDSLIDSSNVHIERVDLVRDSVAAARKGSNDFADCVIAALAVEAGASSIVTFDRDAAKRVPGMELLK